MTSETWARATLRLRCHLLAALIAWLCASPAIGASLPPIEDHYFGATLFVARTGRTVAPPVAVGNLADYVTVYGRLSDSAADHGYHAARLFFANGGRSLYVIDPHGTTAQDFQRALAASQTLPVDLVAIPAFASAAVDGPAHAAIALALADHADASPNRFGIIDAPRGSDVSALIAFAEQFSSRHSAIYAPWLDVADTQGGTYIAMPSTAAVAGIISRIDREQGIFKSPAGTSAALDPSIEVHLQQQFTDVESGDLTVARINALRHFAPDRILVWGARTTSLDSEWRYVAVSRFLRHLQFSINRSLAWVRGAATRPTPNEIAALLQDYLFTYWQRGALAGSTSVQAFFARCEDTQGKLGCLVGVAPLRAAEFIVFELTVADDNLIFASGFETTWQSRTTPRQSGEHASIRRD